RAVIDRGYAKAVRRAASMREFTTPARHGKFRQPSHAEPGPAPRSSLMYWCEFGDRGFHGSRILATFCAADARIDAACPHRGSKRAAADLGRGVRRTSRLGRYATQGQSQ